MRTIWDAKWLISELEPHSDLYEMVHFNDWMEQRGDTSSLMARIQQSVRPIQDDDHVGWDFMAPDFDILIQFLQQGWINQIGQAGLRVRYTRHGLAQAPSQVSM